MKVKVLFFAIARELTGVNSIELELDINPEPSTESLLTSLLLLYPSLNTIKFRFAVNKKYVSESSFLLKEGDEIACLPPISGG